MTRRFRKVLWSISPLGFPFSRWVVTRTPALNDPHVNALWSIRQSSPSIWIWLQMNVKPVTRRFPTPTETAANPAFVASIVVTPAPAPWSVMPMPALTLHSRRPRARPGWNLHDIA